jgi:hypothetical protein
MSILACWNNSNGCGVVRSVSGSMGSWDREVRIICTNGGFGRYWSFDSHVSGDGLIARIRV